MEVINGFMPQLYGRDRMEIVYGYSISPQEKELNTALAKLIFNANLDKMEKCIKNKEGDMVLIKFDLDTLKSKYQFDTNLFIEFAVRREFIKIVEANKMKTYPLDQHTLILTY